MARQEKFYEIRLMAMTYFEKALKADPTNEIAAKNLEIVKVLDNRPHYGSPHRNLSPLSKKNLTEHSKLLAFDSFSKR